MADFWVQEAQTWVNTTYGAVPGYTPVEVDGRTGWRTVFALTRGLQVELGITALSDNFGATTTARFAAQVGTLTPQSPASNVVRILRCALWCKGYQGGDVRDGVFDDALALAVVRVLQDLGLPGTTPAVDVKVMKSLLTMDAYLTVPGGRDAVRAFQQWLNARYLSRLDFAVVPCDGRYARDVQRGLMLGVQYEIGMADGVANGNFGPGTQAGLRGPAYVEPGSTDERTAFVRLFQGALLCNGYDTPLDGTFGAGTSEAVAAFQDFVQLAPTGVGDFATWASLLVSSGDPDRPGTAADTSTPLTPAMAAALHDAGYRTVGRYMSVATKRYRRAELDDVLAAGLTTFPIYQEFGNEAKYFTEEIGYGHGLAAARRARQLGFRPGAVIHFAVDYDATNDDIDARVLRYFEGVNRGVGAARAGEYRVGVYGSRNVCARVCARELAVSAFVAGMSRGWSGNLGFPLPPQWAYDQVQTLTVGAGAGVVTIDKVIRSPRAEPVDADGLVETPRGTDDAGFHQTFWSLTQLRFEAEVALRAASDEARTHTDDLVLHHAQTGRYATTAWAAYTPLAETLLPDPAASEIAAARARFLATPPPAANPADYDGDLAHLAASARAWSIVGFADDPATVSRGDLGSWALDLVALWAEYAAAREAGSEPRGGANAWLADRIGTGTGALTRADLVADVDAYLVARAREADPARGVADVLREILVRSVEDPAWRFAAFVDARFGGRHVTARSAVAALVDTRTPWRDGPVAQFSGTRRPGERSAAVTSRRELGGEARAVAQAFVTVLWRLAGRPLS
ncbi:glycoside hydrolase domain-containing protein [Cellulomonas cellasea]|uniref:Peptidoglycan hydrolase-like protein with peptidoglycan-binding domain n=1 Tax=Cellulomonas cellasea TaxID=43670 RepID=A0A7W4YAZ2_9CELL|nr:glycoside hydrolase domain-containing protein [Cellulomonas cellasea]MBB2922252.1 peptidoglycan hydrolase-like protein with peptidoglycan-binding domain [Cellulomonas cellasea]